MKHFLLFSILLFLSFSADAQSLLPKSARIDFFNPKAPEYKKRYKQHKDSIKTLSKLNLTAVRQAKSTLRVALKEFGKLPGAKKEKTKVKNLESDFREYQSLISEVDSLMDFQQTMDNLREREMLHIKNSEEKIARAKRVKYQPIARWIDDQQETFTFTDSTLSFNQKIREIISANQYGEIAWKELNTEPEVFLDDYTRYGKYWENDEEWLAEMQTDDRRKYDQAASLADKHFSSYDNYMQAKSKANEIQALLSQAKEYTEIISALIKGDFQKADKVASALEARAMRITALRQTSEQLHGAENSERMMRDQLEEMRYKADLQSEYEKHLKGKNREELAKEALVKSRDVAGDHFQGHEDDLAKAQSGLDSYKKGVFNFKKGGNGILNTNSLKGKPLGERLMIGGYLQVNRNEHYAALDFSPQIGYKWTKNYLWGIGGTYRFQFNEKNLSVLRDENIYGGRFFMEYSVGRIFAHGEYEVMSHARIDPATDTPVRIHSPGALFGLGIDYNFMKGVKGNMMVLYNFLHQPETSPYNQPFVFRFGFNVGR